MILRRQVHFTQSFRLRLPTGMDDRTLTRLMAAFAADLRPAGMFQPRPVVRLRVRGAGSQVEHLLDVDDASARVLGRLRAVLPGARVEPLDIVDDLDPTEAVELRLNTTHRPLRTDRADEISSAVLGALAEAGPKEVVELQWFLSGDGTPQPARKISTADRDRSAVMKLLAPRPATWHHEAAGVRAETQKQAEPLLLAVCRIGVRTGSTGRARHLISAVLRSLQMANAPGVVLGVKGSLGRTTRSRFIEGSVPAISWPLALNAAELASLVGWPIGDTPTPGLSLGAARQLPAARSLTNRTPGSVQIGEGTYPGTTDPIYLGPAERLSHLHVVGPTGVGKSTLLANVAIQSIEAGDSVVVLDPKGDLVTDILSRIPSDRVDDVVVLDPSDVDRPVGFNPLQAAGVASDVAVDHVVSVFADLFRRSWGPRTADVLRASLLTLQAGPPSTLLDLPTLLSSPSFRRARIEALPRYHPARSFWVWYEALSDAERAAVIGPLMNKLRAFTLRESVRGVIGQPEPAFAVEGVFRKRRVLLVPLPAGLLGEEASQLIGSLLIARLWQAAQSRASISAAKRRPVWLLLDEFQNFLRLPTRMGDVLAQARGLGLGLTLAHQHLSQLSSEVQADVLANARSRLVFQTGHNDARSLARELPGLEPDDLNHLEPFELYARLLIGSQAIAPASARSLPLPPATSDAGELRRRSRERWGIDRADIDKRLSNSTPPRSDGVSWSLGDLPLADGDDLGGGA
ncbi:MAG: type IV secretory system conjugative DNA transfer family protein [Actinomycetota bacterium]